MKTTYLRNMYLIAMADGKIADEEAQLLKDMAQKMGINETEQLEVKMNAKEQGFFVPDDNQERLKHLEYIIQMMMVDQEIHEKEYNLCLSYAQKNNCSKEVLDMLIEKVGNEIK